MSPRKLFRIFAFAEMFTWAGLIVAIILRAVDVANIVPIAGGIHGFVALSYGASTILVWADQKWRFSTGITGLLLAIVPFATVPFEHSVDRRGLLGSTWRLGRGGEAPKGFIEHVVAWIVRHFVLAVIVLAILVTALFVTLLWLGPPVPLNS